MVIQDYIVSENGKIIDIVSSFGDTNSGKEYTPISSEMAILLRKDLRRLQNPKRLSEVMERAVQINMA